MTPTSTLAALVDANPRAARVFERYGLDYCCRGRRSLADACAEHGIDLAEVAKALDDSESGEPAPWARLGIADLADHLETTHHAYLHEELPRLSALMNKVLDVHGAAHPELVWIATTFEELRDDLEPHLLKEEWVLFPMIRELHESTDTPTFHCGTLANPIGMMQAEHDRAGELLAQLRQLTSGYEAPAGACASYRSLFAGLAQLEADTHLHVHKENNVLFPAVTRAERERAEI